MRVAQIAVAGCGPAGLTAALLLHRMGHRVTLFERFDAPRPLGSGLMIQPTGMAVLAELGLADKAIGHGALVTRLLGLGADGRTVLDAHYADLPGPRALGLGIHRASLFAALHDAVRAEGVELCTGHAVCGSDLGRGGRWLSFADQPDAGPFDLVVDALGVHTPLAPPCGHMLDFGALWATLSWPQDGPFQRDRLEQRYRAAREMVGVFPTGKGIHGGEECAFFWSLNASRHVDWQADGLDAWREEVAALWPDAAPLAAQITEPAQLTFARYAHRTLPAPAQDRLVHIGDAWHSASPQLGQGANMALLDAWAVAEAFRLTGTASEVPAMAVQLRRAHVIAYQHVTALFTPLYQSDAAWPALLRDRLLAPLSRHWPARSIQARLMSGLIGGPLGRLGLRFPDYPHPREGGDLGQWSA